MTSLLIAVRERELGLVDSGRLKRLELRRATLSAELRLLLNVASALPYSRRFAADDDIALRRTAMTSRTKWLPVLESMARDNPVAEYLRLALLCAYPDSPEPPSGSPRASTSLIRFKLATCQRRDEPALRNLAAEVPRFAEAGYMLGLNALIEGRLEEAQHTITEAVAMLPPWPTATSTLGSIAFGLEEFETALARYDEALAIDDGYRDAILGRVKALSYLQRPVEAIASADQLLALGEYFVGDAHYWRAWNLYWLDRHDDADAAVGRAKQYMHSAGLFALAGYVAAALDDHERARAEFTVALTLGPGECDVRYALADIEQRMRRWQPAAEHFEQALSCYEARERELEAAAAKLPAGDHRRGAREREQAEAKAQQGRSALHAGAAWLAAGDTAKARAKGERALAVPASAGAAAELLARLPK